MKNNGKSKDMQLACGLAWFSIGLGLAELFAPAAVARTHCHGQMEVGPIQPTERTG